MAKFAVRTAIARTARRTVACAVALSTLVFATGSGANGLHPGGVEEVADESPASPAVTAGSECIDGFAGGFACRNVELLAWFSRSALGQGQLNDVWGWTDPQSGVEYALLGL
jgi:hypothetical protein